MKKIRTTILTILILLGLFSVSSAQSCTGSNSSSCVSQSLGLSAIDLRRFFPNLPFNDIVSNVATIILIGLVILFGFRIIIAGYKWVNNDGQDKSKKDAIKGIVNGFVGILIVFAAYFIVLFVRSLTAGDDQLINCGSLYYKDYTSYVQNSQLINMQNILNSTPNSGTYSKTTEEFQRCMALTGKDSVLKNDTVFNTFVSRLVTNCQNTGNFNITNKSSLGLQSYYLDVKDTQKLYQCFANEVKNL